MRSLGVAWKGQGPANLAPKAGDVFGFVTFSGRQVYAPLAAFGTQSLQSPLKGRLVIVDPLEAEATVKNAEDVRGAVALVMRGSCTFPVKARRVQEAGAVALIVANNEADKPAEAFKMGEIQPGEAADIRIPCVMLSYENVQELLVWAHSTNDASVSLELLLGREAAVAFQREKERKGPSMNIDPPPSLLDSQLLSHFFQKSERLFKFLETPPARSPEAPATTDESRHKTVQTSDSSKTSILSPSGAGNGNKDESHGQGDGAMNEHTTAAARPMYAFARWATGTSGFNMHYAPLADFGAPDSCIVISGKLVYCDPPKADKEIRNASDMDGAIVLVDRGGCTFPEKITRAQKLGAKAVVVANNDQQCPQSAFVMGVDNLPVEHIRIPSVMISYEVHQKLLKNFPSCLSIVVLQGEAAGGVLGIDDAEWVLQKPMKPPRTMPPLHRACLQGHVEFVEQLLKGSVEVNERDLKRFTPLHYAVISGTATVVDMLLEKKADVNAQDLAGQTPLHHACREGDENIVEKLLGHMARFNVPDVGKQTPLHLACSNGNTAIVELLMAASATVGREGKYEFHGVDQLDADQCTPLHRACEAGNAESALYLLAAGARYDLKDKNGKTALHHVCQAINKPGKSSSALEVIERLISMGATMEEQEGQGAALDLVQNKQLRRDLEIAYLRKQANLQRQALDVLREDKDNLQKLLANYVSQQIQTQFRLQASMKEREDMKIQLQSQNVQLQQLQLQMKTTLQFLQKLNATVESQGLGISGGSGCAPPTSIAVEAVQISDNLMDDGSRAEESALARDIAKKHRRNKDYQNAVLYFRKSLSIMPLPGVQKLLDKAVAELKEDQKRKAAERAASRKAETKEGLVRRYKNTLLRSGCPASALEAIEAEILKLDTLDEGSQEYILARDWLDWLVAMPWGGDVLEAVNIETFTKLEEAQRLDELQKHNGLALRIQSWWKRAKRVRDQQRWKCASGVQALWRGYRLRQHLPSIREKLLSEKEGNGSSDTGSMGYNEDEDELLFDAEKVFREMTEKNHLLFPPREQLAETIAADVDRLIPPRLRHCKLMVGVLLWQTPVLSDLGAEEKERFHILQVIDASSATLPVELDSQPADNQGYYCWNRWGVIGTRGQMSIKGPYNLEGAMREFKKRYFEKTLNQWGTAREEFVLSSHHFKPILFPVHGTKSISADDRERAPLAAAS